MILDQNNVLTDFNDTVYSAVMIPNKQDYNGDIFTVEEIRDMMETFMIKYRNMDINHDLVNRNEVIHIVESFQTPFSFTIQDKVIPAGTWLVGLKVESEEIKEQIRQGKLRGLSATAMKKTDSPILSFLSGKSKDIFKTRTFKELGDFDIIGVSLVDDPSYEDALFFSFKEKDPEVIHSDITQYEKKDFNNLSIKEMLIEKLKDESGIPEKEKEVEEDMNSEQFMNLVKENLDAISEMISTKNKEEVVEEVKEEVKEEVIEEAVEAPAETEAKVEEVETEISTKEEVKEENPVEESSTEEEVVENSEVDTEISTKEKEMSDKITELEKEIVSLKNKSTQPDNVVKSVNKDSNFDMFGRLKK